MAALDRPRNERGKHRLFKVRIGIALVPTACTVGFHGLSLRLSHAVRYLVRMELIIADQAFAVLKIENGTLQQLHLTLNRAPHFKPRMEPVMILVDGPNREPVKLIEAAEGVRLIVRKFY